MKQMILLERVTELRHRLPVVTESSGHRLPDGIRVSHVSIVADGPFSDESGLIGTADARWWRGGWNESC